MVLLASSASTGMFLAGMALLTVIMLRRWHRYYGRRRRGKKELSGLVSSRKPTERASAGLSDAPPDVLRWQVEMHETARELKAEIDSKMIALQVLIRNAAQQEAKLQRLLSRIESGDIDQGSAVPSDRPEPI